jgi:hypothetical protein
MQYEKMSGVRPMDGEVGASKGAEGDCRANFAQQAPRLGRSKARHAANFSSIIFSYYRCAGYNHKIEAGRPVGSCIAYYI